MDVADLKRALTGEVILPDDSGYDAARRGFNAFVDRRPAVIARCLGAEDVAAAFAFAQANGLEVAVRGGGHNPAGHCVLDDGLVIDLSQMRTVEVDADAQIAHAAGGSTWLDFDTATQAHGLVTPGGIVGSTGVCGLTLGGGIGHLTAQHGLTCDNLVGAELVTPDGNLVRADAELLWALRGGGGNFGVATRLDFRLHPLENVVGGLLAFGGPGVRDAVRVFRDVVAGSPRDLSCQAVLGLDDAQAPTLVVIPCYTGSDADPAELRELRSAPGLLDDGVRPRPFTEQQSLLDSPYGVQRHYWKGHFVDELPDELIDELLVRVAALGRPPGDILLESLHGAPKDADNAESALSYRDGRVQRQRDGDLGRPGARRRAQIVVPRDRVSDPAVGGQRRLRQLHAGGRADRARPSGVRRRVLRPPPGTEAPLRPGQRPAPQPEHPAGLAAPGLPLRVDFS